VIRRAEPADLPAMARVHARSWLRAYGEFLGPEALERVQEDELMERWRDVLLSEPQRRVWVWDQDGTIVAHVAVDADELRMLYVDPVAQGAGVGAALHDVATTAGARTLRTFAANAPARAFYEARGWVLDGDEDPWFGEPVVRYRLHAAS
jgi:GNAT superfamily N-acetyltransferase